MKRYLANAAIIGLGAWLARCILVVRARGFEPVPVACCLVAPPIFPAGFCWCLWRHNLGTESDPRFVAAIVAYCVFAVLLLSVLFY